MSGCQECRWTWIAGPQRHVLNVRPRLPWPWADNGIRTSAKLCRARIGPGVRGLGVNRSEPARAAHLLAQRSASQTSANTMVPRQPWYGTSKQAPSVRHRELSIGGSRAARWTSSHHWSFPLSDTRRLLPHRMLGAACLHIRPPQRAPSMYHSSAFRCPPASRDTHARPRQQARAARNG